MVNWRTFSAFPQFQQGFFVFCLLFGRVSTVPLRAFVLFGREPPRSPACCTRSAPIRSADPGRTPARWMRLGRFQAFHNCSSGHMESAIMSLEAARTLGASARRARPFFFRLLFGLSSVAQWHQLFFCSSPLFWWLPKTKKWSKP